MRSLLDANSARSVPGHGRKTNHVRGDDSFPRKRSPDAGDGCTAGPRGLWAVTGNLRNNLVWEGHHEDLAPLGRDAIASTSLAASCIRPAVPENSSLGSAPAASIFTLSGGCRRAPGRLVQSRGAILSIAAHHHHHDRAVSSRRRR